MPPKTRKPLFKEKKKGSKRKPLTPPAPRSSNVVSAGCPTNRNGPFGKPVKRRRGHNVILSSTPIKISDCAERVSPTPSDLVCEEGTHSIMKTVSPSIKLKDSTEKLLEDILFGTDSATVKSERVGVTSVKAQQTEHPSQSNSDTTVQSTVGKVSISETSCGDSAGDNDCLDDDILCGLCPEDLSFSVYNSNSLECTRHTDAKASPATFYVPSSVSPSLATTDQAAVNVSTNRNDQDSVNYCVSPGSGVVKSCELLCSKPAMEAGDGTFYDLPLKVKECFEEYRGIKHLYDWQHRCLSMPSVRSGGNLIYSLPTSGGKTLVAEIIILQQLLLSRRDVLLILPFVSIVQEKVRQLTPFSSALGFAIEEFAASKGRLPPRQRRKKRVLYIATIEKANGLVNSFIELKRVCNLGLVVIDELHMLGDGSSRGATLESCIAKLQYCSPSTQLVGMSATLSNMDQLAAFMGAQVFSSDFRPVELVEQVKLGRCVYRITVHGDVNFDPVRDIRDSTHSQLDPDQLSALVGEVVPQGSCLVFCPTKKSCQNVSLLLTKTLPRSLMGVNQAGKHQLLQSLSLEASGVCPILAQTIPWGVAYHHSGLTADERCVLEEGYLEGTLCVIACTSTLAAGVNLPAKRVILRSPYIGSQLITRSQYKQMVGRAGRSGLCESGDSILILPERDKSQVVSMLGGPYEVCDSSLLSEDGVTFLSLVLNIIGLKVVKSFSDIHDFFKTTLLCAQLGSVDEQCQDALTRLIAMGYITIETRDNSNGSNYHITTLGQATFKGCLPVDLAHVTYQELRDNLQMLVLSTDLHLLYLATPVSLSSSIQPNWMVYFQEVTGLGEDEMRTAELLEIKPGYLMGRATGSGKASLSSGSEQLYSRFYITLILHSLLKLTTYEALWRVADRFHCSRGFLQSVMNSTASHASCLVMFTAELPELWPLHLLMPAITKKLAYSAHLELVPLMEVPGVKQGRARQLVTAGITTPLQLAAAEPSKLVECVDNLFPSQARRLIHAAKILLAEEAEALLEEAEELMSLAP